MASTPLAIGELKIIFSYFDNYMTDCQGVHNFLLLHLFIFIVFYYSKNVLSSYINYCSMNEDVQYESATSSVQVNTSKVDHQFWHIVYY